MSFSCHELPINMIKIESFSLEKHSGAYQHWPRQTRLFFNGVDTGSSIPGYIIEAQYRCDAGYLLITSQDCPFEESNDFLLLSADFRVLAQEMLGVPYYSYLLHNHWPVSDDAIRLHYYQQLFMTLTVRQTRGVFGGKSQLILESLASCIAYGTGR